MADVFSPKKRSEIMSRIRSKNTTPEKIVFAYLRQEGIKFKRHFKDAPGCPDVAIPGIKRAIFIDGDFWHGRSLERIKVGRKETDYWVKKIKANISRDRKQRLLLAKSGWSVLKVWESDLKRKRTRSKKLEKIKLFLWE